MAEKTEIAWCDSTVNFWRGCTKVSLGCANCYAETLTMNRMGGGKYVRGEPRFKFTGAVKNALAMNKSPWVCDVCGEGYKGKSFPAKNPAEHRPSHRCGINGCQGQSWHRRRIFTNSLSDWLDAEVPIEWLAEMLDTIRQCSDVIWILCTKRPENFFDRINSAVGAAKAIPGIDETPLQTWLAEWYVGNPPKNIIVLASVENQAMAYKRIPKLLKIPAVCRGLSLEPLLGPIDFSEVPVGMLGPLRKVQPNINWLIIGGESGFGARPCNVEWIREIVYQGITAGVATFVKQLGSNAVGRVFPSHSPVRNLNKDRWLTDKKGGNPSEWAQDLKVQEFPKL